MFSYFLNQPIRDIRGCRYSQYLSIYLSQFVHVYSYVCIYACINQSIYQSGDYGKNQDYPDHSIVKISQNILKDHKESVDWLINYLFDLTTYQQHS